ncbi:5-formyltetrahydrofolate cyclo-ligase [Clostridium sp. Marseille-P3244]|uniref:5-formyltetrahydrofolate cyclo-ligase n=1 Tax=Clostridium sp. Marseille-P3244 TaxID=1871020 RepID=UPI0009314217|nr:5-formyltetrahydrofolate cyclo-ligase [Clostridium sp. Marseille-P3244]
MKNTETKKETRKRYLKIREEIPEAARKAAQQKIVERLISCPIYEKADRIYSYVSFGSEADTYVLMEESIRRGKKVAVPKVLGPGKMEFYYIGDTGDLKPGFASILEPASRCKRAPVPDQSSLAIVPGSVFDRKGVRIGYGGGYYDVYLSGCPQCVRVALAFSVQCVEGDLPSDPHDIRMDAIITEKELIKCSKDFPEIR